MKLTDREWKEFSFTDVFIIKGGFYNKKPPIEDNGNIPFLGAVDNNNGITEFYSLKNIEMNSKVGYGKNEPLSQKIYSGNCICVTNNGSVGYAYYQKHTFTCSHDINPLYLKHYKLSEGLAMFLISAIEQQKVCFKYSRKWRPKRMRKSKILLPIDKKGNADYQFMENYANEIIYRKRQEYINYARKILAGVNARLIQPLQSKNWKAFRIDTLFDVFTGRDIIMSKTSKGLFPVISHSAQNNGVATFIDKLPNRRLFQGSNTISLADRGNFYATIQPSSFYIATRVKALKGKKISSKFILSFISNQINKQSVKFNYGHNACDNINSAKIMLPTDDSGNPDYAYMEQYTKNMMIAKYNDYLQYVSNLQY